MYGCAGAPCAPTTKGDRSISVRVHEEPGTMATKKGKTKKSKKEKTRQRHSFFNVYLYMSIKIKPVIKWVGGKNKIMNRIIDNIPAQFNDYYEPFLGGASVFLSMPFKNKAIINDFNKDLTNLYMNIKIHPSDLISRLKRLQTRYNSLGSMDIKLGFFKDIVRKFNKIKEYNINRSVLYIFLNKACFNGIMATVKNGELRPSFGYHKNLNLYNNENIIHFSKLLNKSVKIKNQDYVEVLKDVKKGDFVYLDPPYVPDDITNCNIKYVRSKGWSVEEFEKLFNLYDKLDKMGVYVMMSNSYSKLIRKHFGKKKYNIKKIPIIRTISVNKKTRGVKYEVIITNYNIKKNKTMKKKKDNKIKTRKYM